MKATAMSIRRSFLIFVLASACAFASGAHAQAFPSKSIRIIVPQAAGTGPDVLARALAEELSKSIGQPVIVENKPGANGTLSASYTISQPADGHTLFMAGVSTLSWNPFLYKTLPYVPTRDFVGVAVIANTQFVTAVAPSLGVKTLLELIRKAKAEPGKISFASAGIGNSTHLATELLMARTGMQMQHVPFSGAGGQSAATSLMAGETPVMTTVPVGIVPLAKSGKVIALAITGEQRLPQLPEIPTFKELGIDLEVPGWYALVARSGAPAETVQRLNAEINKALDTPQMKERLAQQLLVPVRAPSSEVARLTKRDSEVWGPLIERLGIAQ